MSDSEKLAELRAQAAELEKARAERVAARAAKRALEAAQLDVDVASALEAAEDRHGPLGTKVLVVDAKYADGHRFGAVIVRAPDPAVWGRYTAKAATAKGVEIEHERERLWSPCVVWPELAQVERMVRETPFLSIALGDAVGALAGVRNEEVAGK